MSIATSSAGADLFASVAVIVFVVGAAAGAPLGYALCLNAHWRGTADHRPRQRGESRCTCDEGAYSCPNRFAL
jgi:hypothetical protein